MMKRRTALAMVVGGAVLAGAAVVATACSGDDSSTPTPEEDGGEAGAIDATVDAGTDADAGPEDPVARGSYLVNHVALCPECHTPRNQFGTLDQSRSLSGVECLYQLPGPDAGVSDAGPSDDAGDGGPSDAGDAGDAGDEAGPSDAGFVHDGGGGACLNSRNLTNDVTGLKNRTDAEIRDMFQNGVRPNGEFLYPFMPYDQFHNMADEDAKAIVAYLRTVPPVQHVVPKSDPPFSPVAKHAEYFDPASFPQVPPNAPNHDSAVRGQYLATAVSGCLGCHTPELDVGVADRSKLFWGNRVFDMARFGVPSPPFPKIVYSKNLTQDPTGLLGYTTDDIVREIQQGLARDNTKICPPMPVGSPSAAFTGMRDQDAIDIANYILTIPGVNNPRVEDCVY